jgi:hypothetical protein
LSLSYDNLQTIENEQWLEAVAIEIVWWFDGAGKFNS